MPAVSELTVTMISVVLGSLLLGANLCPEEYSDETDFSKLKNNQDGSADVFLKCGALNSQGDGFDYLDSVCIAARSGAQCCSKDGDFSNCIAVSESDCTFTWCEIDVARSLSDEEIAAIVIGSIAAVGLGVAVWMTPASGIMLLYLAYYIPLIVGFFLLYDPDLLTVYAPETQADANFRVVAVSTIVIVVGALHLILGGLEAGSRPDMSPWETLRARWKVPVNAVADLFVAVSLVLACVSAGLGSADEPGLFPDDNEKCHRVARALYYCPMHGYGLAAAALWLALIGNLFCIVGRRAKGGNVVTGYSLMDGSM